MTSLIFGSIYLGHKGIVNHRREKQRVKNYERWEDLRDDYDEMKKVSVRENSRSLDLPRDPSGSGDGGWEENRVSPQQQQKERGIFTLRDQQEANDARTSWRPQEGWEQATVPRRASSALRQQESLTGRRSFDYSTLSSQNLQSTRRPDYGVATTATATVRPQKTGSVWDEGLPAPLKVSRMSFDDNNGGVSGQRSSYSTPGRVATPERGLPTPPPSVIKDNVAVAAPPAQLEVVENRVPGGRMAELLEASRSPVAEKDMEEWWK